MKETRILMGMPVTVAIADTYATQATIDQVFAYFTYVDETFSTYKPHSEISQINAGAISELEYSEDMKTVFALSEATRLETNGYFNIKREGVYDPSGLVKGWAIQSAAAILNNVGFKNFYIEAGGDIAVSGKNEKGANWSVGIRNPFNREEIVKILYLSERGVATSGTYVRGQHIYNPHDARTQAGAQEISSLTVIGPNIYDADRFATAAFAMGRPGIQFIEQLEGFEGYLIDITGTATYTSGFEQYTDTTNSKSNVS